MSIRINEHFWHKWRHLSCDMTLPNIPSLSILNIWWLDDVVGWQPCITFKSSPWVQGAKCYIILAPAFQRLYERKIGTLKTDRLIEGGRLVQRRSQGRVYFLSVKNIEISLYACASSTVASTFNPRQYFLSLEIPKQISYSFWSYSCIIYTPHRHGRFRTYL